MSGYTAPKCGLLRAADAGREVDLYGWVARRRDHGGLIFIDLRDRWGVVQVAFNPADAPEASALAAELRGDYVVHVTGLVRRRPAGSENGKIATGEIEVGAIAVEVLSPSRTPPFSTEGEADEITRLVGPPGKRQPRRVSPRGEPARIRLKRAAHPSRGSRSRRRWSRPSSRPTRSNRWATASAWSSAT
jgi:hypothetical protein